MTKYPLTVVTVSIWGCKKQKATIISGLIVLWDIGATYRMIKRQHTKPYKYKISSNKVEYSTAAEPYCTTHDFKVQFFMPGFNSINRILHHFHVDKN